MLFRRSISPLIRVTAAIVTSLAVAYAQTTISRLMLPGQPSAYPSPQPGTLMQEASTEIGLHIVVINGEDAFNIVKKKTAVKPVVEVRDRNNLPVAGVSVTFTAPGQGAGASFLNGSRSITLVTDATGRASVIGKPVGTGAFKLTVSASFHGQLATASIAQTNVLTAAALPPGVTAGGVSGASAGGAGGLSAGVIAAIVGGVAAAAVGIGVGVAHGHSSSAVNTSSAGIGSAGGVTVGPPH